MPSYTIMFARLVRETAEIKIDANSPEEAKAKALAIYEDDEVTDWEPDYDWGPEDGTHYLVGDKLIPLDEIADVDLPEEDQDDTE